MESLYSDLKHHVQKTFELAIELQLLLNEKVPPSELAAPTLQLKEHIDQAVEMLRSDMLKAEVSKRGYDDRQEAFYGANAAFVTEMNKQDRIYSARVAEIGIRAAEILAGVVGLTNSPVSVEVAKRR
ncbi:hypothetical protein [Rhizobium leguminosarum]|uniref:hypothetical protein n=1 Tax=Rhizobium leguminosarum TaxID=384 RepID=UPI003F9BF67F